MSPSQLRALFRRHMVAVIAVIILAVGVGLDIKTTPPTYGESATVVFMMPGTNSYSALGPQLIPMASLMTATITSTEYISKIHAAGGEAAPDVVMVNLYNEQFPDDGVPYVTISAKSSDAAAVGRTFSIIVKELRNLVWTRQAQANVPRWGFVSIRVVGNTGIQALKGSRVRVVVSLAVLTLMVLFTVVIFLDRRRPQRAPYDPWHPAGLRMRLSSLIT